MKKRNLKDVLFGITIGGLIFGGIGVAAVTLTAKEIRYTPNNEEFDVTNVQEAIDELYNMTGELEKGKLTLVGTTNSFNIADIVGAENVGKYTADDFVCVPDLSNKSQGVSGLYGLNYATMHISLSVNNNFTLTYDDTTGDVTIVNMKLQISSTGGGGGERPTGTVTFEVSPKVYLVV